MPVLEEDEEQQDHVARLLDGPPGLKRPQEQQVRRAAAIESRNQRLLDHPAIEDALPRWSRPALENTGLPLLEGEGHVLHALGHQVKPQELERIQRSGTAAAIARMNSTISAALVLISR